MASVVESDCHKDPNFAVLCSFFERYGELLGLPSVSYSELEDFLEDTSEDGKIEFFFLQLLRISKVRHRQKEEVTVARTRKI